MNFWALYYSFNKRKIIIYLIKYRNLQDEEENNSKWIYSIT